MLYGRRLSVFLFLAILAVPFLGLELFGQEKKDKEASKDGGKVTLAWKFDKDKTFYQTMKTTTTQTMKVMNNDVTQKQEQTFYFSWTPEKEEGGKWILTQTILGVKMDIDIGGSPIKYDSTSAAANNTSNPLNEFFKALVGSKFRVTIDPKTYKIVKIEGRDDFVKKLVQANKQMEALLNQILSEKALMEMAEPTFAVVPAEPVEKGKPWKKETTLDMGPIGTYKNEYTYTYEGEDKNNKLDTIKVDTKLTYSAPQKAEGPGGLPFKIKSADLKSKSSTGTVWFNREKGRVEKSKTDLELTGQLKIEIGGQQTDVDLNQKQTTEIDTSDTNPVEAKAPTSGK